MSKSLRANSDENVIQHRPRGRKIRNEDSEEFLLESSGVRDEDFAFMRLPKRDLDTRKK